MFCKHCGNDLPDDATFCAACGNFITTDNQNEADEIFAPTSAEAQAEKKRKLGNSVMIFALLALNFPGNILGIIFSIISKVKLSTYKKLYGSPSGITNVGDILGTVALVLCIITLIITVIITAIYFSIYFTYIFTYAFIAIISAITGTGV